MYLHPEPHECRKIDRPFLLASVVFGGVLLAALVIYVACRGILSARPNLLKSSDAVTKPEGYSRF